MLHDMKKYIGRDVEIIYLDSTGSITKRQIRVRSVKNENVQAYCYSARAPRVFKLNSILAVQPTIRKAG